MSAMQTSGWASWDARDFERLAAEHGTPFFVYDADAINARIRAVRRALDDQVEVYYAVKANPSLGVLQAIRGHADGLDISSAGELEQACLAGFDPSRLSFAGPGKTAAEIASALARSVCISAESVRELRECSRVALATRGKARCTLRINPATPHREFGLKMGGKAVQFGVDEEELPAVLDVIDTLPGIDFEGIHVYVGSQCFDVEGVVGSVRDAFALVERIEARGRLRCTTLNLGGGFGVSATEAHKELDLAKLACALNPVLREFLQRSSVRRRLVFELGRYLTSAPGIYVCRVVSAKTSRGKQFFVVDGGLHHHLAAAGTFGAALRSNYMLRNLTRPTAAPVDCHVAGPSCNPTDLLGIDLALGAPEEGDLIGVLMAGSYGLTASPLLFLGRSTPAEWVIAHGEVRLARRPHAMSEFN